MNQDTLVKEDKPVAGYVNRVLCQMKKLLRVMIVIQDHTPSLATQHASRVPTALSRNTRGRHFVPSASKVSMPAKVTRPVPNALLARGAQAASKCRAQRASFPTLGRPSARHATLDRCQARVDYRARLAIQGLTPDLVTHHAKHVQTERLHQTEKRCSVRSAPKATMPTNKARVA